MFRKFSEWAVAYAIRLGYIKEEEQEEYTYGLDLVMSVIASDLTMLIIGIIMKMIPQVIVFVFMYKFIRKYTDNEDEHLTNNSMQFHEHMGFRLIGTFKKCGYKFDKWYDMIWMEKFIGEHKVNPDAVIRPEI